MRTAREHVVDWIGVDLDGTLAEHYWGQDGVVYDPLKIGKPIPVMQFRVLGWLAEGRKVKVFTARVAPPIESAVRLYAITMTIHTWCLKHLGQALEVTCVKDRDMIELWDDKAMQVRFNEGVTLLEELQDDVMGYVRTYGTGLGDESRHGCE